MISRIYLFFLIPGSGLANSVTSVDVITFLVPGSFLETVLKSVLPSNCTVASEGALHSSLCEAAELAHLVHDFSPQFSRAQIGLYLSAARFGCAKA